MNSNPSAHVLFGLSFGDEGKGTMTDYLCRISPVSLVVRYSGADQAAHNVVTEDGRHHTFSQFGSGTFVKGVKTLLSRYMLWNPIALALETKALFPKLGFSPLDLHYIDSRAPVITPFHVAANRLKEWMRGQKKHGSCGKGVGETASDLVSFPAEVVYARDLASTTVTEKLLASIQERKRNEILRGINTKDVPDSLQGMLRVLTNPSESREIAKAYCELDGFFHVISPKEVNELVATSTSIFEGAQGVLLDEWHGFHPFTTWSTTTPKNALSILEEANFHGPLEVTGILRAYTTRHGAGPLVTEDENLTQMSPEEHNGLGEWQGAFRFGAFDGVLLRYARDCVSSCAEMTSLALTHLDVFERTQVPFCDEYLLPNEAPAHLVDNNPQSREKSVKILKPNFRHDLRHQEELTALLQSARAVRAGSFGTVEELVGYVRENSGVPIRYGSFGPGSQHKRMFR